MSSDSTPPLRKVATLRDRLFVNGAFVTEGMLDHFKSEIVIGRNDETGETITEQINHYQINYVTQDNIVYSFNRGDLNKTLEIFKDFEILDERVSEPMRNKLKIRFKNGKSWRPYQPDAIDALVTHDYGILKAPPRAGKTAMLAATICMDREKTIVFAHQTDLLEQLYDTFLEFTNLEDLQAPGNPVVGFAKTLEEFDRLDVVLCTKQTFDHVNNKGMLMAIQRMFGSVWIDEVHYLGAEMYSKTVNRFWAKTRRGVTATPKRKDGLDVIMEGIIGPVVHEITRQQVNQAPMEVTRINTGLKLQLKTYVKILAKLVESKSRNELILEWMVKDVKAGRTIVAVTDRKEHQQIIKNLLKEKGIECEVFNGSHTDRKVRKRILGRIRDREVPVLIAMRSMTTGLDVPCADTFYNLLPSSNAVKDGEHEGEGGYEQQCTRVRTVFPGKAKCYVRDFVDNFGLAYSAWNARRKTYNKIGAYVHKTKEDEPEAHTFGLSMMDDGL